LRPGRVVILAMGPTIALGWSVIVAGLLRPTTIASTTLIACVRPATIATVIWPATIPLRPIIVVTVRPATTIALLRSAAVVVAVALWTAAITSATLWPVAMAVIASLASISSSTSLAATTSHLCHEVVEVHLSIPVQVLIGLVALCNVSQLTPDTVFHTCSC
jgi:hypothetical protein